MPSLSSPTHSGDAGGGGGYTTIPISGPRRSYSPSPPPALASRRRPPYPPLSSASAAKPATSSSTMWPSPPPPSLPSSSPTPPPLTPPPLRHRLPLARPLLLPRGPLVVYGRDVSDTAVLGALVAVSAVELWLTGCFWSLVLGAAVGVALVAVHGLLRNAEGVYLDEEEAASWGLIGSRSSFLSDGARK